MCGGGVTGSKLNRMKGILIVDAIGNLQRVPLRQVWGSEPNDFTPWLEENIDVLNDTIGLSISISDREHKPTERLSVVLLGETETGRVVIENQLEASNKDGKIAAAMDIEVYGGTVVVSGYDRKSTAGMNINEDGGNVAVSGKHGKSTAGMGITFDSGAVFVQDRYGVLKILD